jgi:hypothetical protein
MSCGLHPDWVHDAADCPMCAPAALQPEIVLLRAQLQTQAEAIAGLTARNAEYHDAARVLYTAVRGDEKAEWWPIRHWLDERDIYNDDIESLERLVAIVCQRLLGPSHATPEARRAKEPETNK